MFKDVPEKTLDEAIDPVAVTLDNMDRYGIETGHDRRRRATLERARHRASTPTASSPSVEVDPNDGMDAVRKIRAATTSSTALRPSARSRRAATPGADQRQAVLPDLRHVRRARHPDLRDRRHPRAAGADRPARTSSSSTRSVRLPRADVRDAPRRRAVDRAGREAHAQVAEPLLLDRRRSRRSTTRRRSSTTPTPAAPTRSCTPATSRWACRSSGS